VKKEQQKNDESGVMLPPNDFLAKVLKRNGSESFGEHISTLFGCVEIVDAN